MPELLRILTDAGPWVAVFAAFVILVFVVFTGAALWVALFSDDQARAERAREILKDLLGLLGKGSR